MIKLKPLARKLLASVYPQVLKSKSVVVNLFADGPCNSRCLWCINQYSLSEKMVVGKLTFVNLKRFLDFNEDNKFPLITYGQSEPTIHKEFVPFCNYILDRGWNIEGIHTDLSSPFLKNDVFRTITRFHYVTVNFGGAKIATQLRNMGTDLNVVLGNLKRLVELSEGSRLRICVKMVLNRNNVDEAGMLKHKLSKISSRIEFSTAPLYFSVSDGSEEDKRLFFDRNLSTFDGRVDGRVPCREYVFLDGGRVVTSSRLRHCYGLIPTVRFNGDVVVCCRARWYGGVVGNAFVSPLKEILESDEYKFAESRALKREYVQYCKFCS